MASPERDHNEHNRSGDSPDRDASSPSWKWPKISLWVYLAILVALGVHLFIFYGGSDSPEIDYSVFLDYIEEGHVESVEIIDDAEVRGLYTREAMQEGAVERPDLDPGLLGSEPSGEERRRFVTTKPTDHELTQFLRDHNQQARADGGTVVQFSAVQESDWWSTVLMWGVILVLFIALWVFLMRRMQPNSQMLDMGENKAKLFDATENHSITFDDVAGLEEPKEEVAEVVEFLKNPKKFTRLGGTLPKGVILVGPPGTGKTLLAKAVAGEAGVPFFSLSGSDFVEMFVGVGASRVRDLFKKAKEQAPCIVFIDEMDAIGRSRGRNSMVGGNDERENTLNQLLVEMDGFDSDEGVIIMAATNRPDVLDDALMRPGRFDRQIVVDKPDRRDREEIFDVHVRNLLLGDDVRLEVLAGQTPGFAGAEIANVCNEAALLAARKDKEVVEMDDFEQAIDRVIAGLEKKNKIISPEERKIIAVHEAGHAIVGWFSEHTDPVVKVSIVPRGLSALGYAQHLPEERYLYSREALLDRMTMTIGGRVAEEIAFGRVTTGAQNDLERITRMAYAMVVDYGMSERIGQVSFNLSRRGDDEPMFDKPYSEDTARLIDKEVKSIIDEVRDRARALLEDRRDKLDEMAEALLEQEVLGPSDLVDILGERPHGEYVSANGKIEENGAATDPSRSLSAADEPSEQHGEAESTDGRGA